MFFPVKRGKMHLTLEKYMESKLFVSEANKHLRVEMKRLYDLGFDMAKDGYQWNKTPPPMRLPGESKWLWTP